MTWPDDPRGNYPVDTLLHVIQTKGNLTSERWNGMQNVTSNTLLVGSGDHWQAVMKDKEGNWYIHERCHKDPVQNLQTYLQNKLKHGAVYQFKEFAGPGLQSHKESRKRALEPGQANSNDRSKRQEVYALKFNPGITFNLNPPKPKAPISVPHAPFPFLRNLKRTHASTSRPPTMSSSSPPWAKKKAAAIQCRS